MRKSVGDCGRRQAVASAAVCQRYKRDELRLLCRTNSIPYYYSLKGEAMIDEVLSLEDITRTPIPEL